jgi:hypothetical protein
VEVFDEGSGLIGPLFEMVLVPDRQPSADSGSNQNEAG